MKITQVISIGINGGENIIQKYLHIRDSYLSLGVDYRLIIISPLEINYNFKNLKNIYLLKKETINHKCLLVRLWLKSLKQLNSLIKKLNPDYIILRIDSVNQSIYKFIKKHNNIILDYPNAPIEKTLQHKTFYQKLAFKYNHKILSLSTLNFVTIANTYYPNRYLFPNSLNFKKYLAKNSFDKNKISKELNILLMSSKYGEYEVNGYDRLFYGIQKYLKNNINYKFNIYLAGKDMISAKKFFSKFKNTNVNILYLDFSPINELNQYIDKIDLGVNDIGCHRENIYFNSTLKTVDFIGWNLPFLVSHNDTNISKEDKYL